jgi:tRNA dimethylallyltransferase
LFPFRHLNALKTVGYQELFDPMEGRCSREAAVEKIKQHTRNYAKRQITWFRKDPEIRWLKPEDQAEMTGGLPFSQGS